MISASLMKETAMSSGFFVIIFSPVGFQMWAESLTGDLIGAVLIRSEQKWQRIWKASPLLHHIQIKLVSFRNKKSMFDCKGGIQVICNTLSADPLISFNLFWTCRGRSVCRWGRCVACPLQAGDRWKTHAAGVFLGGALGCRRTRLHCYDSEEVVCVKRSGTSCTLDPGSYLLADNHKSEKKKK